MDHPTKEFRHSAAPFLSGKTHEAIQALVAPEIKRLVIYCGAGATIDRTGLSWRQLIGKALRADQPNAPDNPTPDDIKFWNAHFQPAEVASILTQYLAEHYTGNYADCKTEVVDKIRTALYHQTGSREDKTWNPALCGRLAGNVARLASLLARQGKSVIIVTTNYDIFLEEKVDIWMKRYNEEFNSLSSGLPSVDKVGLDPSLQLVESSADIEDPNKQQQMPLPGQVGMMYLHGQIPKDGSAIGDVVLTELDYANSRSRSTARLSELLRPSSTGFLTLGASLNDSPLIDALATTPQAEDSCRYALVPIDSMKIDSADGNRVEALVRQAKLRGKAINITILIPDFNCQVAQFCQELFLASSIPANYAKQRYIERLKRWWRKWKRASNDRDCKQYETLRNGLTAIEKIIFGKSVALPRAKCELFKLELWIRKDPEKRQLVRWATSIGPNYSHDCDPSRVIGLHSNSAVVRALVEGRPLHLDYSDLDSLSTNEDRRWRSFLAVPIWLPDTWIPVGVLTLASSKSRQESAIPLITDRRGMEALRTDLIALGRTILDPKAQAGTKASA